MKVLLTVEDAQKRSGNVTKNYTGRQGVYTPVDATPGDPAEVGEMPTRSRHCKRDAAHAATPASQDSWSPGIRPVLGAIDADWSGPSQLYLPPAVFLFRTRAAHVRWTRSP